MAQTYTRVQIREQMQERGLVFLGQTDAAAPDATRIRDATRMQQATRDTQEFGEAYLRIQGTAADANSDPGYVGKISYLDPVAGDIYTSPNTANVVQSGKNYEVWKYGIWPDDVDRSIDRAAANMCSVWRIKPLSYWKAVEEWSLSGYNGAAGGATLATLSVQAMAFPTEYFEKSLLVTGGQGGAPSASSESEYVQPLQAIRVYGFVSVRAGTAQIALRDITNGADLSLNAPTTRTGRGWQFFILQGQVPAGCSEIQIRLGGTDTTAVVEWAGVGCTQTNITQLGFEARVRNEHEVGNVFALGPNLQSVDFLRRFPIYDIHRERAGSGTRLWTDSRLAPGYGIYYEERHHYAPFCSPASGATSATAALTTAGYLTKADRMTGDAAATDCDLRYLEAAAVVDLLRTRQGKHPALPAIYAAAYTDLAHWEAEFGAPSQVHMEHTNPASMAAYVSRM